MQKGECETAIRHLCHRWAEIEGSVTAGEDPKFFAFYAWVADHYPACLKFRTTTSVRFDVELWFDQEFKLAGKR